MYQDRTAWRCAFLMGKKYGSKGYPQRNAAHVGEYCLLRQAVHNWVQKFSEGRTSIEDEHQSSARVVPTATKRIFRRRFPGTCETVGQVFKSVWRLC